MHTEVVTKIRMEVRVLRNRKKWEVRTHRSWGGGGTMIRIHCMKKNSSSLKKSFKVCF